MFVNKQPRRAADRISIRSWSVGDREPEVVGNLRRGHRRGDRFERWLYKLPRSILHLCVRHFILDCVYQFHIPERTGRLLNLPGHAFVAFASDPSRPIHGRVRAHFRLPFRADFAQVIGPNVSGPAPIRPVHDYDFLIRQFRTRIQRCDFWVIPFFNVAEKNPGNRIRIKLQRWVSGQIVGDHIRTCHRWNVQKFPRGFAQIVVAHRPVRRAEIHRLRQDLLLSAAGSDRLIIKSHRGIDFCVFVEPLRVNWIRERRPRAVDHHLRRSVRAQSQRDR